MCLLLKNIILIMTIQQLTFKEKVVECKGSHHSGHSGSHSSHSGHSESHSSHSSHSESHSSSGYTYYQSGKSKVYVNPTHYGNSYSGSSNTTSSSQTII